MFSELINGILRRAAIDNSDGGGKLLSLDLSYRGGLKSALWVP